MPVTYSTTTEENLYLIICDVIDSLTPQYPYLAFGVHTNGLPLGTKNAALRNITIGSSTKVAILNPNDRATRETLHNIFTDPSLRFTTHKACETIPQLAYYHIINNPRKLWEKTLCTFITAAITTPERDTKNNKDLSLLANMWGLNITKEAQHNLDDEFTRLGLVKNPNKHYQPHPVPLSELGWHSIETSNTAYQTLITAKALDTATIAGNLTRMLTPLTREIITREHDIAAILSHISVNGHAIDVAYAKECAEKLHTTIERIEEQARNMGITNMNSLTSLTHGLEYENHLRTRKTLTPGTYYLTRNPHTNEQTLTTSPDITSEASLKPLTINENPPTVHHSNTGMLIINNTAHTVTGGNYILLPDEITLARIPDHLIDTITITGGEEIPTTGAPGGTPNSDHYWQHLTNTYHSRTATLKLQHRKTLTTYTTINDYINRTSTTSRIHPTLNTLAAVSGRMSMYEPNLQQTPHILGREFFLADPEHTLISCDFPSIEPRIAAIIGNDEGAKKLFTSTSDLYSHLVTLITTNTSTGEDPIVLRQYCKHAALAFLYGANLTTIAKETPLTITQLRAIAKEMKTLYPGFYATTTKIQHQLKAGTPFIITPPPYHRPIRIPYGKHNSIGNYLVQSVARDVFSDAIINLDKVGIANMIWLVIHDECIFNIPTSDLTVTTEKILTAMNNTIDGVPITVTVKNLGERWATKTHPEPPTIPNKCPQPPLIGK